MENMKTKYTKTKHTKVNDYARKLLNLLRRYHFCPMVFWAVWGFIIYTKCFCLLPDWVETDGLFASAVLYFGRVLWCLLGIVAAWLHLEYSGSWGRLAVFLTWVGIVPFLYFFICKCNIDNFYEFGGFMPGLEAIGWAVEILFYELCVVLAMAVIIVRFLILKINKKRKAASGRFQNERADISEKCTWHNKMQRIRDRGKDVLNILALLIFCLLVLYKPFVWGCEKGAKLYDRYMEKQYLDYRADFYEKHPGLTENDLLEEGFGYVMYCQMLAMDEDIGWVEDVSSWGAESDEEKARIMCNLQNTKTESEQLKRLMESKQLVRMVEMINAGVTYDRKEKCAICYYEMKFKAEDQFEDYYILVCFDEELISRMYYVAESDISGDKREEFRRLRLL